MSNTNHTPETNEPLLQGGCLCGAVSYQITNQFSRFMLCHCQQCQQLTGSAFAANIFTSPKNIEWLTGQEKISHYRHRSRDSTRSFCAVCSCALPYINQNGKSLIIPAGSLSEQVENTPVANMFEGEQASWLVESFLNPSVQFAVVPNPLSNKGISL